MFSLGDIMRDKNKNNGKLIIGYICLKTGS